MDTDSEQRLFGGKDKVTILLAEYNTLRNEILLRNSTLFQSIGIASAAAIGVLTLILSRSESVGYYTLIGVPIIYCLICAPVLFIAIAAFWVDRSSRQIASRLRDLELEINT